MLAMIFMQATEIPMMKQNNTYTKHNRIQTNNRHNIKTGRTEL